MFLGALRLALVAPLRATRRAPCSPSSASSSASPRSWSWPRWPRDLEGHRRPDRQLRLERALRASPADSEPRARGAKFVGRLTEADGRAIAHEAVSVSGVAPWVVHRRPGRLRRQELADRAHRRHAPAILPHPALRVAKGANWTESDETLKTKVCLVGATVVTNLFGTADPVG